MQRSNNRSPMCNVQIFTNRMTQGIAVHGSEVSICVQLEPFLTRSCGLEGLDIAAQVQSQPAPRRPFTQCAVPP